MKKIHLLMLLMFISALLYGCSGGDESTLLPGRVSAEKFLEVSGTLAIPAAPVLAAPSNSLNAFNFNGGKHSISVVDKDNPENEIGSVTMTGNNYKAVIPVTNTSLYPQIIIKENAGSRILYRSLIGRMIKTYEMPSSVYIVKLNGINIDAVSTARALFAIEKGAPDVSAAAVSSSEAISGVIYKEYGGILTPFDEAVERLAGGGGNVSQAAAAVAAVAAVLNSFEIEETVKTAITAGRLSKLSDVLMTFVNAQKNSTAQAFIKTAGLAESVTIGGSVISDQTVVQTIPGIISVIVSAGTETVSAPLFSLASGTYAETSYLSLTTATPGAAIYYTDDGTSPSKNSKSYSGPIVIDSSVQISAIAIKTGMANSFVVSRTFVIDKTAPVFSVQYYSDSSMENAITGVPRLKTGTYYLKVASTKPMQTPPKLSINAEGTANDAAYAQTVLISGNDYEFDRVIKFDPNAKGVVREDIFITWIDAAGVTHGNLKPVDESSKAAFTDTVRPSAAITYSAVLPVKQGTAVTINAEINEELSAGADLEISLSGSETRSNVTMSKTDARHYSYIHTVSSVNGEVFVVLGAARDLAGNLIEETPASGKSFIVGNAVPTNVGGGTVTTPVPLSKLSFDNAAGKVVLSGGELVTNINARLDVFFGAYPPVDASAPAGSTSVAASHQAGDLITGISAQTAGNKIYYRFVDAAGKPSKWVQDGTVPATTGLTVSKIYASAAINSIKIDESHATSKIAVYVNDLYRLTISHENAAADSAGLAGTPLAAGDTLKYSVEDAAGNRSLSIADGSIPSTVSLAVSKIYASASVNRINVAASHTPLKIALYVNNVYRQTITHAAGIANSVTAAGEPLAAGDSLKYAVEESNGNHSVLVSDGSIPAVTGLDVSKIYASAPLNMINIDSAHASAEIAVYVSDVYRQTVRHIGASPDSAELAGIPLAAGNTLKYAVEDAAGNHSVLVSDGAVPAATGLDVLKIYASAALNSINIDESHATLKIAVFVNDAYRQKISHINATANAVTAAGEPLSAGDTLKYAVEDANGNHSAWVSDGTIPETTSLVVSKIYANAGLNKINIADTHKTIKVAAYVNDSYRQTITHVISVANAVTAAGEPLLAGDTLKYAVEDANGNHSALVADGAIPVSAGLDAAKIHASGALNSINVDAAHGPMKIAIFISDVYRQTIEHAAGTADMADVAGAALAAGNTLKYSVEDAAGNHSVLVSDGSVPATTGLDVLKIRASAALNGICVDESHPTIMIAAFVNDTYRQTINHVNAVADIAAAAGTQLSAGDTFKYAVEDINGNYSALVPDGSIPPSTSLDVSKIYASEAFNRINVEAAHPTLKIAAYVNGSYRQTILHALATANSAAAAGEPLAANDTLGYAVEESNGNHSALVTDGSIPSASDLDVSKIYANAALNSMIVDASHPSLNIAVFVNDIYRQTISHAAGSADAVTASGSALAAGNTIKYAAEDAAGNQSSLAADGTIPPAPSALSIPAVAGRSNANYITAASAASFQSINASFAAVPAAGAINITIRSAGGELVDIAGAAATTGLVTNMTGLDVDALTTDGLIAQFSATITNASSGNISAAFSQITTGMYVDKTPPSFTAQLRETDGVTRIGDNIPAGAADKLILTFSENVLAATVNTAANTGINTDFLIIADNRSTAISGFTAAGASTFTNTVAVANNIVTITLNSVPTTPANVMRNSSAASTAADADTIISCAANQITDAAGNPAVTTAVPVK